MNFLDFNSQYADYFHELSSPTYCLYYYYYPNHQTFQNYTLIPQVSKDQHDPDAVLIKENVIAPEVSEEQEIQNGLNCRKKIKNLQNMNTRNIIPNICKKLFRYLLSENAKSLIDKFFPDFSPEEYKSLIQLVKSSIQTHKHYIGKKDIKRLWNLNSQGQRSQIYKSLIRKLSYRFLTTECAQSIVTSKRIKNKLIQLHLFYRRRLLAYLIK